MTKYNTHTLENGLRIIHLPSTSQVVYCGYQIAAGTRHERLEAGNDSQGRQNSQEGLAHFCEHLTFKGTRRRNALQVINCLEQLGGDLNAFTTKEDTTFYAAIQREHIGKAVDLLTDIVFCSQYPQHEVEREVEVVCDEIESYNDSPSELIFDEFENILFAGHPLGHNVLGQAEQLRTYTSEDALAFVRCHYRPDNAVFFAYGDLDFEKLVRAIAKANGNLSRPTLTPSRPALPPSPSRNPGGEIIRTLGTHQAHVMLGTVGYDIHHPRRIPLYLLNNILGGPGMNARLNLSLRERHGLVYTVESTMVSYSDCGLWAIYFGCDQKDIGKCLRLVRHQLDTFMQKPLSATRLQAAKRQLKGQIAIACDNREQFALDFGKSFLHYGWEKDITDLFSRIDAVTADEIQQVANELFATDRLTTLIFK